VLIEHDMGVVFALADVLTVMVNGQLLVTGTVDEIRNNPVVNGGTGYLAALLRPLVGELVSVNAADAAEGNVAGGPFTLIVVDGAIAQVPEGLTAALAEDGRIISGLVLRQVTRLASGRKVAGRVNLQPIEDLGIPVLHAFDAPKTWTFA